MAKQAGYDLDKLCAELNSVDQTKQVTPEPPRIARTTIATEEEAQEADQVADAMHRSLLLVLVNQNRLRI